MGRILFKARVSEEICEIFFLLSHRHQSNIFLRHDSDTIIFFLGDVILSFWQIIFRHIFFPSTVADVTWRPRTTSNEHFKNEIHEIISRVIYERAKLNY